jgi:hypothetical protein
MVQQRRNFRRTVCRTMNKKEKDQLKHCNEETTVLVPNSNRKGPSWPSSLTLKPYFLKESYV